MLAIVLALLRCLFSWLRPKHVPEILPARVRPTADALDRGEAQVPILTWVIDKVRVHEVHLIRPGVSGHLIDRYWALRAHVRQEQQSSVAPEPRITDALTH
jgi:hypothetical protein